MFGIQPGSLSDIQDERSRRWAAGGLCLPARIHVQGDEADASRTEIQKRPVTE